MTQRTVLMSPSTEAKSLKRLNELKEEVRSARDPFELAAELALDNERLRLRMRQCSCDE